MKNGKVGGFFVFSLLIMLNLVIAANIIRESGGTVSFGTVNEDTSRLYNFSINNTDTAGAANITELNITLPSGFTFATRTNWSSFTTHTFSNTSTRLTWTNATGLILNVTTSFFAFNATAATPGTHNFSVVSRNASGITQMNITVTINDTTIPSLVEFTSPSLSNYVNVSANSSAFNVSVTDNGNVSTIMFLLYNSTGVYNSSNYTANITWGFINFTGLADGTYKINATANDTNGNVNVTGTGTRTFILDTGLPIPSIDDVDAGTNRTQINITITASDNAGGTGISGSCTVVSGSGSGSVTGTGGTQYVIRTGLSCGNDYSFNVSCTDFAGNIGYAYGTFSTDNCDSGSGSSSGGNSGGTTASTWINTYSVTESQFQQGHNRALAEKERLKIKIGGVDHHIGVVDIDPASVKINVSSTPQQARFDIGDLKKFEVTGDSYYDVSVKLNSIASSKANITVIAINEIIPAIQSNATINSTGNSTVGSTGGQSLGKVEWFVTGIFVIIIALVVAVLFWKWYDRRKRLEGLKSN